MSTPLQKQIPPVTAPAETWTKRLTVSLAILIWTIGHMIVTLISLVIAVLLAYSIYPLVTDRQ